MKEALTQIERHLRLLSGRSGFIWEEEASGEAYLEFERALKPLLQAPPTEVRAKAIPRTLPQKSVSIRKAQTRPSVILPPVQSPPETKGSKSFLDATNLDSLHFRVRNCVLCDLCNTRSLVVFGAGNQQSDLLILGDQPDHADDLRGLPFFDRDKAARVGLLMTQIILSLGLTRESVYLSNLIKCRPEADREANAQEISACSPIFGKQIELLSPKAILALGENTFKALGLPGKFREEQGQRYKNIPLVASFHPRELLLDNKKLHPLWEDLRTLRRILFSRS